MLFRCLSVAFIGLVLGSGTFWLARRIDDGYSGGPLVLLIWVTLIAGLSVGLLLCLRRRLRPLGIYLIAASASFALAFFAATSMSPPNQSVAPVAIGGSHIAVEFVVDANEGDVQKFLCEAVYRSCSDQQHDLKAGVVRIARTATTEIQVWTSPEEGPRFVERAKTFPKVREVRSVS